MFYLNDWLKSYKILNIKIKLKTKTYRWLKLLFTNEIKLKVSFVVVEESFVETFWFEIGVKFRAKGFLVGITNIWQRILITPTMLVLAHNHSIHEQRQPWRQRQQPTTTSPRDQTRHTLPYPPLSLHISLTVRLPLSSGPDLALRTCRWCHQTICIAIRRQYCDGPMIHFFSAVLSLFSTVPNHFLLIAMVSRKCLFVPHFPQIVSFFIGLSFSVVFSLRESLSLWIRINAKLLFNPIFWLSQ